MKQFLYWVVVWMLLMAGPNAGAQQLIDFDDVPDGTDISSHYPGLTFSCDGPGCKKSAIFARATPTTPSAPNGVSPVQTGSPGVDNQLTGAIKIQFSEPVRTVSIDAFSALTPNTLTQGRHAILVAQNASGNQIDQAVGTRFNAYETLTVSAPNNAIQLVFLGVENVGMGGAASFDNLKFSRPQQFWQAMDRTTMLWVLFGIATLVVAGGITAFARRPR